MRRALTLVAVGVSGLVLAIPASGALEVRLSVSPQRPSALSPAEIVLRTYATLIRADGSCCRFEPYAPRSYPFRVEAVSPSGKTSRIRVQHGQGNVWRGDFRFPVVGRWRVRLPQFRKSISVTVGSPVATRPPPGFGPLGKPDCMPASPANRFVQGFRDVFGTAVGGERLWALPFLPPAGSWATPEAAVFDGVVGDELKVVVRMSDYRELSAVAPDSSVHAPSWGPVRHSGSTWRRPGAEWGVAFMITEPGCWRIRAGAAGDWWFLMRS